MILFLQDLLRTALTVEEERERETQKLEKKLQLAELTHQQREEVWLKEMTQGILDGGGEERDDDIMEVEGERNIMSKRPVRAEDRKTKKQRRKEKERKTEVRRYRDGNNYAVLWCDRECIVVYCCCGLPSHTSYTG